MSDISLARSRLLQSLFMSAIQDSLFKIVYLKYYIHSQVKQKTTWSIKHKVSQVSTSDRSEQNADTTSHA